MCILEVANFARPSQYQQIPLNIRVIRGVHHWLYATGADGTGLGNPHPPLATTNLMDPSLKSLFKGLSFRAQDKRRRSNRDGGALTPKMHVVIRSRIFPLMPLLLQDNLTVFASPPPQEPTIGHLGWHWLALPSHLPSATATAAPVCCCTEARHSPQNTEQDMTRRERRSHLTCSRTFWVRFDKSPLGP